MIYDSYKVLLDSVSQCSFAILQHYPSVLFDGGMYVSMWFVRSQIKVMVVSQKESGISLLFLQLSLLLLFSQLLPPSLLIAFLLPRCFQRVYCEAVQLTAILGRHTLKTFFDCYQGSQISKLHHRKKYNKILNIKNDYNQNKFKY